MFIITTGHLNGNHVVFIYDGNTVDAFVSLRGSGRVIMQAVTITV
jgi:hypothetical protein